TGPIAKEASPLHPRFKSLKKSLPLSSMTIKTGKSAPDTCVVGALRAFGLLLFDRFHRVVACRPRAVHGDAQFYVSSNGRAMSALGQKQTFAMQTGMSALPPCVDGSELARTFLNVCSIGRCSHVFGLFARFT